MSLPEIIGTLLGVIGVGLMIRQNIWGWPVGLVQVALSAWVFVGAKLYSDALLQLFFFALQAYGWWHWLHGNDASKSLLPVTRLKPQAIAGWCAAGAVATLGWGELMRRTTDAALPHWDAFILVFSVISQGGRPASVWKTGSAGWSSTSWRLACMRRRVCGCSPGCMSYFSAWRWRGTRSGGAR